MKILTIVQFFQRKTDSMMLRIKDAEHSQVVAEMRHRIAELEIEVSFNIPIFSQACQVQDFPDIIFGDFIFD